MKPVNILPVEHVAMAFAIGAHSAIGQRRRYTEEPYWRHCREVAGLVREATGDPLLVAAAWLHDVLEDTKATEDDMAAAGLPALTVMWVREVTDVSRPEDGNRAARKALDREHLAKASPSGQTVKLADLISNCRSISDHDPNFARVYLDEMDALLPLLHGGNGLLYINATQALVDAQAALVARAVNPEGSYTK